jgi:NTP pyrophosphatase (non-canonical NTP hydrolase)
MQREHQQWRERNFPDQQPVQAILGMTEELGELCHAYLKHSQGIRDIDGDKMLDLIKDAHADLIIFSFGLASALGYDVGMVLQEVWDKVKKRDWINHPDGGS